MSDSTKYNFEIGKYTTKAVFDDPDWTMIVIREEGKEKPIAVISSTQRLLEPCKETVKNFLLIENNDKPINREVVKIPIEAVDSETPKEFIERCIDKLPELMKAIEEANKPTDLEQIKTSLIKEVLNIMESESIPEKGEALKELLISTISSIKSEEGELLSDLALVMCEVLDGKINEATDSKIIRDKSKSE